MGLYKSLTESDVTSWYCAGDYEFYESKDDLSEWWEWVMLLFTGY